ncbi:MAG: hypothetical protein K2X71_21245 [Methylobacterium sp.]|uniref:hypothetical protein n=1 Tax=Methylobacterium sp. TaxID=409 RepID=UPI0025871AF6|nr:hypothetical protein [Methylobacterium sp.]MBY0298531.1 hypothetical protein [Methylobacterium sp.]
MAGPYAGGPASGGARQHSPGAQGGSDGGSVYEQAAGAARDFADRASEHWDDAAQYGSRALRRGQDVIGEVDGTTMAGWFVAGAIGFGLAWLMFGQRSVGGDYVARGMSRSSDHYR